MRGSISMSQSERGRKGWGEYIHGGGSRRTMNNKRVVFSVLALLFGLFMAYCSLFYLPAFASDSLILRLSSEEDVSPSINKAAAKDGWFSPYLDLLRQRRGYIQAGQTIEAIYILSEPADIELSLTRCGGPKVIEVFQCKPVDTHTMRYENKSKGVVQFIVPEGGFYQACETVIISEGQTILFDVIWRRK